MKKNYGGIQPMMRVSTMTEGCLGGFNPLLQIGNVQSMVWKEGDNGPYCMQQTEREALKNDLRNFKYRMKSKQQLLNELEPKCNREEFQSLVENNAPVKKIRKLCRAREIDWRKAVEVTVEIKKKPRSAEDLKEEIIRLHGRFHIKPNMKAAQVKDLAENLGVATTKDVEKNLTPTWVGKPKGMFDIAYKRGLLNLDKYCVEDFTEKGLTDHEEETSLVILLSKCSDFMNEDTLLTKMVRNMEATLERSPKYHSKVAGEGIEYSWGNAKMCY